MPIGSEPPNTTQATAIEIKPASVSSANWKYNQPTSWYPYGDVYPPPAGGGPPPIYTELWYKFKPGVSFIPRTSPTVFSVVVKNIGSFVFHPPYSHASVATVYNASNSVIVSGKVVQFNTGINGNDWYYIKVVTPPHVDIAQCFITIEFVEMPVYPIKVGAILVQDNVMDAPIVALPTDGAANNQLYTPKTMLIAEPNHSLGGTAAGDILITGETCIADVRANGISVRDKNYVLVGSPAIGNQIYYIKANANRRNFWVSYVNAPNNICRAVEADGSLGIPYFFADPVIHMCAFDYRWLFYHTVGSNAIKMHDLVNNVVMPDLVPTPSPYIGEILDILASPRGTVIVNYSRPVGSQSFQHTIREYHIPGGFKVSEWNFASNFYGGRINYGEDFSHIYAWTIESSIAFPPVTNTQNTSFFRKIRLADGVIVYTRGFHSFRNSALIDDQILYANNSMDVTIPQRFGAAGGSSDLNFWVSPIQVDGGTGIAPPPWGLIPPESEYPPGTPQPPFVFPPTGPPPVGPPQPIGGGIMVLDPDNITRHDVYYGVNEQEIVDGIPVTIRTAFIGD